MGTYVPMTSQASAWSRLRRALDHGNLVEALSAASELESVGLAEALELCLLLRDDDPDRYRRAASRWHGRFCREVPDATLEEAQAVLALLCVLGTERRAPAARSLAELVYRRGLERLAEVLIAWAEAQGSAGGAS